MVEGFGSALFTAMGWTVVGFLGAIPILLLTRWWSEGYVSASEFIGIAFMFIVMVALLMSPIPPVSKGVVFLLLAGSSVGMPYFVAHFSKRDAKQFEQEKEMAYRASIANNPGNVAARTEFARNLYGQGRRSEAIEVMEQAVRISPKTTEADQYNLKRWLQERDAAPEPKMICRWCREETLKDRPFCLHCERPTSSAREVRDAVLSDIPETLRLMLKLIPVILIAAFIASNLAGLGLRLLFLILVVGGLVWYRLRPV